MKIKIVGFKVGESRPTANRTHVVNEKAAAFLEWQRLGFVLSEVLGESPD